MITNEAKKPKKRNYKMNDHDHKNMVHPCLVYIDDDGVCGNYEVEVESLTFVISKINSFVSLVYELL